MPQRHIYIFAATGAEARVCRRVFGAGSKHDNGASETKIVLTGIGPAASRAAAIRTVAALRGDAGTRKGAFMVTGTCGGLSPELAQGAVVIYATCLTTAPGGQPVGSSPALAGRVAQALAASGIPFHNVVGMTSSAVAATRPEKRLLATQGATVVDMESYEVVAAAREAEIPCVVVRAVSDSANLEVPDFTRAIRADGSVDRLRAARIALGSPLGTARLMAAERCALRSLGPALEAIRTRGCLTDQL